MSTTTSEGKGRRRTTKANANTVTIPLSALQWLIGAGPDEFGNWFGDAGKVGRRGAYWWRTDFIRLAKLSREDLARLYGGDMK